MLKWYRARPVWGYVCTFCYQRIHTRSKRRLKRFHRKHNNCNSIWG